MKNMRQRCTSCNNKSVVQHLHRHWRLTCTNRSIRKSNYQSIRKTWRPPRLKTTRSCQEWAIHFRPCIWTAINLMPIRPSSRKRGTNGINTKVNWTSIFSRQIRIRIPPYSQQQMQKIVIKDNFRLFPTSKTSTLERKAGFSSIFQAAATKT